ncbi:MAG: ABC transporter ATP-binding protein [Propionibacteriales bacterium]|nr:ABC transporter ATP-binding protein [Propionibacteriales bacterium]
MTTDLDDGPVIEARKVSKSYGDVSAIREISLTVRPGEIVGLVGESGSGKSTLASCLGGLMRIDAGEVRYAGELVAGPGDTARVPRLSGVQMIFQDPHSSLNPRRSVGSVLSEIVRVHRMARGDAVSGLIAEALGRVGLGAEVTSERPSALSGGMCQRVAIARALLLRPRLLIADEVVSSLDATVQAQVLNLLADLRDDTGVAILFVTHDLAVVSQLCDQVAVMHDGTVVEAGDTDIILSRPQDAYTQTLLASVPSIHGVGSKRPA